MRDFDFFTILFDFTYVVIWNSVGNGLKPFPTTMHSSIKLHYCVSTNKKGRFQACLFYFMIFILIRFQRHKET